MSLSPVNSKIHGETPSVSPGRTGTGMRWGVPDFPRMSVPAIGALIFAALRVLNVVLTAIALRHAPYVAQRRTLVEFLRSGDGGHYWTIAAHGYAYPAGQIAHASSFSFFPAYPALIDAFAWLPGITITMAGLIVTAATGLAAAWGLTRLGLRITGDPRISVLLVAIWAVAPSSSVLSMMYAEALFCALAFWALYALVEQRWLTVAGLTIGAGLVRSTALALIAAVGVAALIALIRAARERQPFGSWWRPAAVIVLAPLGLLSFLGFVAVKTHRLDGWFWIEHQTYYMSFDWGVSTLRMVKDTMFGRPPTSQILVILTLAAAVVLLVWSLTERIPVYLHVYTLAVVALAFATSANWVGSKPRFLLPAVLLGLPLARVLAPVRIAILVLIFVLLAAVSTWFSLYLHIVAGWAP
ncbi:MAG: hypothetical protein WAK82_16130 [Streptosporangiaceae bacterium]